MLRIILSKAVRVNKGFDRGFMRIMVFTVCFIVIGGLSFAKDANVNQIYDKEAIYNKGLSLMQSKKYESASLLFEQVIGYKRSKELLIFCYTSLGKKLTYADPKGSISYYKKALKLKPDSFKLLILLGYGYNYIGNIKLALKVIDKAYKVARKNNNRYMLSNSLLALSTISSNMGKYDNALLYLNRSLTVAKKLNHKRSIALTYLAIGGVHLYKGEYRSVEEYINKAYDIFKLIGNDFGIGSYYTLLGEIARYTGDYNKALDYYNKGLSIANKIGFKLGASVSLNNLGLVSFGLRDYDKAVKYFNNSIKAKEEINYEKGIAYSFNYLSQVLIMKDDLKTAKKYINKSLNIFKRYMYKHGIALALHTMGKLHVKRGDIKKGIGYFNKAFLLRQGMKTYGTPMASIYLSLADGYYRLKAYKKAILYQAKAIKLFKDMGHLGLKDFEQSLKEYRAKL